MSAQSPRKPSSFSRQMPEYRVLLAVNFPLPDGDYRVLYARGSHAAVVLLASPARPSALARDRHRVLRLGEGLRPSQCIGLYQLYRLLRAERRELSGVHFFSSLLYLAGPFAARASGVPYVLTVTGFGRVISERRLALFRPLYWLLLRHAIGHSRAVVIQNRADLGLIEKRFPRSRKKLHYVPSAVEFPTHERSFDTPVLRVLLVARVGLAKGVGDFCDVAEALAGDRFQFTLVGPPSPRSRELLSRVEGLQAKGTIDYRGPLHDESLHAAFAEHHIFFLPSRAEGLPRVLLEAGFSGMYPVAYDIPANRDVVASHTVRLVPVGDTHAVGSLLRQLGANRLELARGADRFHDDVTSRYTAEAYIHRMDELIEGLLPRVRIDGSPAPQ
ncbi:MAG: glycosyl transferase family 1 [Actinomycetia bacterium]|nr:glycosyl transferase family 1 [Actinomycetes bacterium]